MFQKTIVTKYLNLQNQNLLAEKWHLFASHFHNAEIQENIRNSKEEQYQEGFLRDLFVQIFGYTLNPEKGYNLLTELKNVSNSKKADGAILLGEKVISVIELKGTETTDLGKVETQAFGYKANQRGCIYVITSNFEKLRFYIEDSVEFLEFNLFTISENDFKLLYLCLAFENISQNIPLKIKQESISQEDLITKKLYKDYSVFKQELFADLVKNNPDFERLELFKKSQKLLDRLLFLFFGEDRYLLPPNSVRMILEQWEKLKELDEYIPLYERFKKYFNYLNTGFKGKQFDVFAYNGGLFKPDEILDNVKISDDTLFFHTKKIADYDFASEVDVNILGHIFENSLNEIDGFQEKSDKQKETSKRKKDGVFYTPKYITKYIVENTVGKLCETKKQGFQIFRKGVQLSASVTKKQREKFYQEILDYKNWLLKITICDPACGSGAFLNQALNFLIDEHRYIAELEAKLTESSLILSDVETSILENNLFGVDINEESVEIAKLSLWLRTAQPNRKLNDLSQNIKCGNSLINNEEIAGEKSFDWEKEFPQIFENGGFDVIIGNPPYVLVQRSNTKEETLKFYKTFEVASYKIDLFHLFFEKGINILKENGKLGFITPNTYLSNKYIQKLRNFILENTKIDTIINYEDSVFADASVDVATIILSKEKSESYEVDIFNAKNSLLEFVKNQIIDEWKNDKDNIFNIKENFNFDFTNCLSFEGIGNSYFGIQAFDRKSSISDIKLNENYLPLIDGSEVNRYEFSVPNKFFNFISENIKSGGDFEVYKKKRIVVRQIGQTPIIGICEGNIVASNTLYNLYLKDEKFDLLYVLSILNSNLIKKYWLSKYSDGKQLFPKIKGFQLKQLPIKNIPLSEQEPFISLAEKMLSLNTALQKALQKFLQIMASEFEVKDFGKTLQNWHNLSFADFAKELAKKKILLSLSQKAEWLTFFETEKQNAEQIKNQILATNTEIDNLVYKLYGVTEEEILIINGEL